MRAVRYDQAILKVFDSRDEMGKAAATEAGARLRELLAARQEVNCVFGSAPSQDEVLAHLVAEPGIAWDRVNAFHMDEYIGLAAADPRSFASYLQRRVFDVLPFKSVHILDGLADPAAECARYAALLESMPTDIVFMGIGENGHIAFNDPPVADFDDPLLVKRVELEQACRQQQVNDGCFAALDEVPKTALTLTIPALLRPADQFCVVPGPRKAPALKAALTGPVGVACPASALRSHAGARIYADADAAGGL